MSRRRSRLRTVLVFALAAMSLIAGAPPSGAANSAKPPTIAAASDLRFVLEEIVDAFRRDTGIGVRVSFGSSGNLARQIRQGAPFDIYMSADESYVLGLARDGFTRDDGALYAMGRLVLFAPAGSPVDVGVGFDGLRDALTDGSLRPFAIANPDHAPYGRAAMQALTHAGLWESIGDRLVLGENVSQAAQFAASGSADGGIFAHSLARAPGIAEKGSFWLIPTDWHAPLWQRMVLLKRADAASRRFYDYLQRPAAREIMRRHGFELPDED